MSTPILNTEVTQTKTLLGPLTAEQRVTIMEHARPMNAEARRLFRRLLVLSQQHGLTNEGIARAATQAHEHDAG